MKYFLWLDSRKDGPHDEAQVRELLDSGDISPDTLAIPEDSDGVWEPLSGLLEKQPLPVPPEGSDSTPPEGSGSTPPVEPAEHAEATNPTLGPESTIRDETASTKAPSMRTSDVQQSIVAQILFGLGCLELIGGPIAGGFLMVDGPSSMKSVGLPIILAGVFGGLILIGFATLIEHGYESAQRLRQIELCIKREQEDKERLRQIDLAFETEKTNPDSDSQD